MGALIYLDNFRSQEPDLPPTACGGMVRRYVVDPSVLPKPHALEQSAPAQPGQKIPTGLKIKPSPMGQRVSENWESNTSNWD